MPGYRYRPTVVTVFGILNILFGVLGLCGLGFTTLMLAADNDMNPLFRQNPALDLMRDNRAYMMFMKVGVVLGGIVTVILIAAGIGLLRMKPWARQASINYAIYSVVMGLVGMVVNYFLLVQPLMEKAQQLQGPEDAGAMGGAIGGMFGGCFGQIYPIILLIFMCQKNVKQAFQQQDVFLDVSPTSGI